ncbi:MAG TPA: hypothetical protein VJ251_12910 [Stellaceae bacterium]|nr:hypothetical protein [Stellaceae bacterium]
MRRYYNCSPVPGTRRDLSIIAGSTGRNKIVRVVGDPQRLVEQVAPEIARLPGG